MRPSELLQQVLLPIHKYVARSKSASALYLRIWSILLRRIPDGRVKRQLVYTLQLVAWPEIELPVVQVLLGGSTTVRLRPHVGEFDFLALFFSRLPYEEEVFAILDLLIAKVDFVIEIGANVGTFTLYFAKRFAQQDIKPAVLAFEPARLAFVRLYANLALNEIHNVQVYNCAVGDQDGFASFFEPQGHLTNGSLDFGFASNFSQTVEASHVLMVSGDTMMALAPPGHQMLIKIDVEGAEAVVLRSLEQFIIERSPYLLIEVLAVQEWQLNEIAFLHEHYTLYNITDHGLIQKERFSGERFRDYLLVPRSTRTS